LTFSFDIHLVFQYHKRKEEIQTNLKLSISETKLLFQNSNLESLDGAACLCDSFSTTFSLTNFATSLTVSSHLEFDLEPLSIRMSLYDILQLFSLSNEFTQVVATSKRSTRTEKTGNCPARNGAFHIRCPSFRLLLMSSTHTPFVCLSLYDLSPVLMLRQSDAALDTKINASCDFFNHRINCWEPMVEAFQVVLGLNSQHNDNGSNSLFIFSIVQGNQDSSDRKVLELVLSEDFILALLSWMSNMTPNLSISGKYHEFEVINSTGVPLMFWIESKSSSPTILKLRPDELVPLYNIFSSDSKGLETSQFISLQIEGGPWDPILSILLAKWTISYFLFNPGYEVLRLL